MEFIDVLIYILACFGLLFTMISIVESNNCMNCNRYYYNYQTKSKKDCEVLVEISGFENIEIDDVIDRIKKGKYNDINEIAKNVKIIKYN